jgi:hypothetical protein
LLSSEEELDNSYVYHNKRVFMGKKMHMNSVVMPVYLMKINLAGD